MKHSNSFQKSEQNGNTKMNGNLENNENKSLEHHLKQVKQENYGDTFPKVENWLYQTNIQLSNQNQKNERKLHKMKNFFFANKLRLVYTVVALALIVAACNMPVTQTESAGQMITLTVPADNTGFAAKMNALPWMKNAQVTANENTDGSNAQVLYTIVLPNTTAEQVKQYGKELEALGGISTIKIASMNYDVKRPLYSAALDNFFSIKVDATGMNDEEVQKEIDRQLKEQGVDMKFYVKTGADGRRDVMIEKTQSDKGPRAFELTIDDEGGKEKIKMMEKKADPDMFKGKTDDEIRKMIKQDHPEAQDKDIKIIRDGDKVQVRLEIDKKEMK